MTGGISWWRIGENKIGLGLPFPADMYVESGESIEMVQVIVSEELSEFFYELGDDGWKFRLL